MKKILYLFGIGLSLLMMFCLGANNSNHDKGVGSNVIGKNFSFDDTVACKTPSFKDYYALPYSMESYFEYYEGLSCSRLQSKPNLIFFDGYGSRYSGIFEFKVLSTKKIRKILERHYVLTTLYVDSKKDLPPKHYIVSEITSDTLKIHGEKNTYYQKAKFKNDSIPALYIINSKEEIILGPYFFNESPAAFEKFLNRGIALYTKQ